MLSGGSSNSSESSHRSVWTPIVFRFSVTKFDELVACSLATVIVKSLVEIGCWSTFIACIPWVVNPVTAKGEWLTAKSGAAAAGNAVEGIDTASEFCSQVVKFGLRLGKLRLIVMDEIDGPMLRSGTIPSLL